MDVVKKIIREKKREKRKEKEGKGYPKKNLSCILLQQPIWLLSPVWDLTGAGLNLTLTLPSGAIVLVNVGQVMPW